MPRLYVELELDGTSLALDESEAHYLGHVLRLSAATGSSCSTAAARNARRASSPCSGATASCHLRASRGPLPESPLELTLVQALAKADAMDLIVQKATELGVRALTPVYTEFSVVKLDTERSDQRVDHWRKIARSACEQCGRHRPAHRRRCRWRAALAAMPAASGGSRSSRPRSKLSASKPAGAGSS